MHRQPRPLLASEKSGSQGPTVASSPRQDVRPRGYQPQARHNRKCQTSQGLTCLRCGPQHRASHSPRGQPSSTASAAGSPHGTRLRRASNHRAQPRLLGTLPSGAIFSPRSAYLKREKPTPSGAVRRPGQQNPNPLVDGDEAVAAESSEIGRGQVLHLAPLLPQGAPRVNQRPETARGRPAGCARRRFSRSARCPGLVEPLDLRRRDAHTSPPRYARTS